MLFNTYFPFCSIFQNNNFIILVCRAFAVPRQNFAKSSGRVFELFKKSSVKENLTKHNAEFSLSYVYIIKLQKLFIIVAFDNTNHEIHTFNF